ncbi:MAG: Dihydrodipicolinate synthase/N-acetylneuraminate lyase-like protein [Nocardioidaceae bacterium]|nr:Dihydrodipicolinate synthase/N-acetylneuraminate lyase-like protein [Nocardioidaceae bacterium]
MTTKYDPDQARAWALDSLRGCCGCVSPTFTSDLTTLNETAIRHDVNRAKEHGLSGLLIVSEAGTTPEEMRRFTEIVVSEAGDDLVTVLQASQPTLADTVASVRDGAQAGVDLVMPSYPLYFNPSTTQEVVDFTKAVADAGDVGVVIFAMDQWNFGRLHAAGFSVSLLEQMVDGISQVVAIKNEVGGPGVGGIAAVFERFTGEVVVTDPLEFNSPAWIANYDMQFMGTSNYEVAGPVVPQMFELLSDPATWDKGMELYWQIAPVRRAHAAVCTPLVANSGLVPRMHWKYQGWLNGYNGGPIRQPHMRASAGQMATMRAAAVASGLDVTGDADEMFYVGRNPQ